MHANSDWSSSHLNKPPAEVAEALLAAFFEATGAGPVDPLQLGAHRWGEALAADPLTVGCLWEGEVRIGVCGDWCQGSRIEGAFLSGMALSGRILGAVRREGSDSEQGQMPLL